MEGFFAPPPDPWPEQSAGGQAPRWTGRPHGRPPGEVVSQLVIGRSDSTTLSIDYLDAYPGGFELEIAGTTSVPYLTLGIDGERPDMFGRHWPQPGQSRDRLPEQLLRIGVEFSDGRSATSVTGHQLPVAGPLLWPLGGGAMGATRPVGVTRLHQGYWISPLPPPGLVRIVCEWPVAGIPESSVEIGAQAVLDAAERARSLFPDGSVFPGGSVRRDGRDWRVGSDADVAFIARAVGSGTAVAGTIPPIYAAYCTVQLPAAPIDGHSRHDREFGAHEQAVLDVLTRSTDSQPWWLGYLDTGASDVVFPYAPRVAPFAGHQFVLVEAGPEQAASWRPKGWNWALPDLIFPADHSWLLSTGWDDDWTRIGGSEALIRAFASHPVLGPRTAPIAPFG